MAIERRPRMIIQFGSEDPGYSNLAEIRNDAQQNPDTFARITGTLALSLLEASTAHGRRQTVDPTAAAIEQATDPTEAAKLVNHLMRATSHMDCLFGLTYDTATKAAIDSVVPTVQTAGLRVGQLLQLQVYAWRQTAWQREHPAAA